MPFKLNPFIRWRQPAPPVLVYQMGKVGSSTVHQSLGEAGIAVEQVQFLSPGWIQRVRRQYLAAGAEVPENVLRSERIAAQIQAGTDQPWKVISLVRDPIARNISSLFETLDPLHPDLMLGDGRADVPRVRETLLQQFAGFDEATDYVCNWFDEELRESLGIDVFQHPFPQAAGFQVIETDEVHLLVLRLDDLVAGLEPAVSQLLGTRRNIPVRSANRAASKHRFGQYRQVLETIEIPEQDCARIYSSRFCRHFWPANTLDGWSRFWSDREGREISD